MPDVVAQTNFPGSLDTPRTLVETANNAYATLTAPLNAGDLTATVDTTARMPISGSFTIENEIVYYTGKTFTTLTGLTRGREGTTDATHASGLILDERPTAGWFAARSAAIIATQTKLGSGASTPDNGLMLVGNGTGTSAWRALASGDITTALGFTPAGLASPTFTGTPSAPALSLTNSSSTALTIGAGSGVSYTIGRNSDTGYLDIQGEQSGFIGVKIYGNLVATLAASFNSLTLSGFVFDPSGSGGLFIDGPQIVVANASGGGNKYVIARNSGTGFLDFEGVQSGYIGYNFKSGPIQVNGTTVIDASRNAVFVKGSYGTMGGTAPTYPGVLRVSGESGSDNSTNGIEIHSDGTSSGYGWRMASIFDGVDGYDYRLQSRKNALVWSTRVTVTSAGSFLIGTNSAADPITGNDKFKVVDGSTTFGIRDSSGQPYFVLTNGTITGVYQLNTTYGLVVGTNSNHAISFRTNTTERVTITAGGDVNIISGGLNFGGTAAISSTRNATLNSILINYATSGYTLIAGDGSNGPWIAAHTDLAGNSLVNNIAMRLRYGVAGFGVDQSAATAVGVARTWTNKFLIDAAANITYSLNKTVLGYNAATSTTFTGNELGALHVAGGNAGSQFSAITFGYSANSTAIAGAIKVQVGGSGSAMYFGTSSNYSLGITNTAMIIDTAGTVQIPTKLLMGTSSGFNTTADFYMNASSGLTFAVIANNLSTSASNNYGIYAIAFGVNTGTNIGIRPDVSNGTNNRAIWITTPAAGANNYAIYSDAAAKSYFVGNIGIGTTTPNYKLVVGTDLGSGIGGSPIATFSNGASTSVSVMVGAALTSSIGFGYDATNGRAYINSPGTSTPMVLTINGTPYLTIATNGLVSTTTTLRVGAAAANYGRLQVYTGSSSNVYTSCTASFASDTTTKYLYVGFYTAGGASGIGYIGSVYEGIGHVSTAYDPHGGGSYFGAMSAPGVNRLIDTSSGAYLSSAGVWSNNPSWKVLKQDIVSVEASETAELLRWVRDDYKPVRYRYKKNPESVHFGFLLDDMPENVREIVTGGTNEGISTKDSEGLLFALIHELAKEVKELRSKLE